MLTTLALDTQLKLITQHSKSTFGNRTQSNSIRGLSSIEFGNRTKSNGWICVSSISEPIELNRTQSYLLTDHILSLGRLWGDLIVRARLQFGKYSLSRSCSLIFFKTLIFTLLHIKSQILVAFYYAFKANNPRRIWSHFSRISAFTKNTCYTPGYTEVTPRTCWFSTPLSCTKITSSKIKRAIQFDCTFFCVSLI